MSILARVLSTGVSRGFVSLTLSSAEISGEESRQALARKATLLTRSRCGLLIFLRQAWTTTYKLSRTDNGWAERGEFGAQPADFSKRIYDELNSTEIKNIFK